MTKEQFSVCVIVCSIAVAFCTQISISLLDQATAKQCKLHDWPASADQIHRDWCVGNGYEI